MIGSGRLGSDWVARRWSHGPNASVPYHVPQMTEHSGALVPAVIAPLRTYPTRLRGLSCHPSPRFFSRETGEGGPAIREQHEGGGEGCRTPDEGAVVLVPGTEPAPPTLAIQPSDLTRPLLPLRPTVPRRPSLPTRVASRMVSASMTVEPTDLHRQNPNDSSHQSFAMGWSHVQTRKSRIAI